MSLNNKFLNKISIILNKFNKKIENIDQKLIENKKNKISFIQKIKKYIIKKTIIRQNRRLILSYLADGLKRGSNLLTLIIKYKETLNPKNIEEKIIIKLLQEIENIIKTKGTNTTYILYQVGLLNEKEYLIISNYTDLYLGLEVVIKLSKQQNNFNWAIALFFFPPFLVLIGLLIFQPELKEFTYNALAPINQYSTTRIVLPHYLENRTFFAMGTVFFLMVYFAFMYFIVMIKNFKPLIYFKIFRLSEKEFIVNTFSALLSLRRSGKSYIQAYKILSETTNDKFISNFYNEIYVDGKNGNNKCILDVSKKYNMDKFTLSYFKTGTINNDLDNTIQTILSHNQNIYKKQIARLVKYLPLVGEIIMSIILLKPLIDIIMLTTVGVMNFTL